MEKETWREVSGIFLSGDCLPQHILTPNMPCGTLSSIPSKIVGLKIHGGNFIMKLSTKGRYGLRAMIDLASHMDEEAVSLSSIARRENISESYLEQLAASLKKAGLVTSSRGAQGGYKLGREASVISVGDVLRACEGSTDAVSCPGMNVSESKSGKTAAGCAGADVCVSRYVWEKINTAITDTVDSIYLSELVAESRKARSVHPDEWPSCDTGKS